MPKLIKSYIDSLKIEEKSYEIWDIEIKGFGCMVHPSGRKTYYFVYRYKSSKKQRLKIGVHGNITCETAREIVRGWAGDLARGLDPKEHNKKQETDQKHSLSMEAFLRLYIEKYKKIHNKQNTVKNDMYKINTFSENHPYPSSLGKKQRSGISCGNQALGINARYELY